jgi:restriction endonuclease S subunit
LFGKRRAYQRKVAVAEFDGLCSSDILVFEPKDDRLLPELLPFICQSDGFFEHALDTSAGSLSPRTKFKELARYEFPLPPLDEQRRIAEILWAADKTAEMYKGILKKLQIVENSYFMGAIDTVENSGCCKQRLGSLLLEPPSYGANAPGCEIEEGKPRFIRITDIDDEGSLRVDQLVGANIKEISRYILREGDFLFARSGTVGRSYYYKNEDGFCFFAGYLIRFRLNQDLILPKYLFRYTKTKSYFDWVAQTVRIGAQPNINASEYSDLLVPLPTITKQTEILELTSKITNSIVQVRTNMTRLVSMKKQLLEEALMKGTEDV